MWAISLWLVNKETESLFFNFSNSLFRGLVDIDRPHCLSLGWRSVVVVEGRRLQGGDVVAVRDVGDVVEGLVQLAKGVITVMRQA